jgi:hypothetical protein
MKKRQKVRYEFYSYETSVSGNFNVTLTLNNPASVKFILTGIGTLTSDFCTINNLYNLQPIFLVTPGPPRIFPSELILQNQINEIDVTDYQIRIQNATNTVVLKVVVKYYID